MAMSKVLIVDDDDDIRETLSEIIAIEGYQAISAANGREALDLLMDGVAPCVVLLDLMMPVMNGWELLEALRQDDKLSAIPVVAITAGRSSAPLADHTLRKPLETGDLLDLIASVCGKAGPST